MPRYEARIDLTGSSADVEASLASLADASEETADKLEERFSALNESVTGSLAGIADDGSTSLSALGDSADTTSGRIEDAFSLATGKVTGSLDDMAAQADEKSGLISASFDKSFAAAGDAAEGLTGRIGEALDGAVSAADERGVAITDSLERTFATGGAASEVMVGRLASTLDQMVAETTEKSALITARLDEAFAKGALAAEKLKATSLTGTSSAASIRGVSSEGGVAAELEQIEALNKAKVLSAEQTEAARSQVLNSISGGSLSRRTQLLEGLGAQGLISDEEVAAAKNKLVGLRQTAEEEAGGIKSKIAGAFKGIGSSLGNFGLPFTEQFNKMGESIEHADTKAGTFKATLSSLGKLTTEVGIGAAIGISAESVHLADQYDASLSQLETAVKNSGTAWSAYAPKLKDAEAQTEHFGFTNTQTAQALQILTTAFGSPKKALSELVPVMDLARLKQESLSDAATTYAKINAGSTRAVTQLGLNLDIGSGKLHNIQNATEAVTKAEQSLASAEKAQAQQRVAGSDSILNASLSEKSAANSLALEHVTNAGTITNALLSEQIAAKSLALSHLAGSNAVTNALEAQKVAQAEVESGQVRGAAAVGLLQKSQLALTQAVESGSLKGQAAQLQYEKAQQSYATATQGSGYKTVAVQLALEKAQDAASQAAEKASYGQVAAAERVLAAQTSLADKQLALKEDQNAIPTVFATLNERTKGAAAAFSDTLPGQIKVLDAELQHLGITFGEWLTPKLEEAGKDLEGVLSWLQKNKGAAEALGIAVGGVLTLAVGVFVEQKLAKLVSSLGKAAGDLHNLEQGAVNFGKKIFGIGGSPATTEDTTEATGAAESGVPELSEAASSLQGAGDTMQTAARALTEAATKLSGAAGSESAAAGEQESAAATETEAATTERTAGVAETEAATTEKAAGGAETAAAGEETAGATAETRAATTEESAATTEKTAASTETSAATAEQTAAGEETTAAGTERSAATAEEAAGRTETAAAGTETSAASAETGAATTERAAAGTETAAAGTETTAAGVETTAATAEEAAATTEKTAALTEETAATAEEAGATEEIAGGLGGAGRGLGGAAASAEEDAALGTEAESLVGGGALGAASLGSLAKVLGPIALIAGQDLISNFSKTGTSLTDSGILGKSDEGNTGIEKLLALAQKDNTFLTATDLQKGPSAALRFDEWAKSKDFTTKDIVEALSSTGLSKALIGTETGVSGADLAKWFTQGLELKNGGTGTGSKTTAPGSSVTNQYNLNNATIQANDPGQLARQLAMRAKRKNMSRT